MQASAPRWWLKRCRTTEELESQDDVLLVRGNMQLHREWLRRPDIILAASDFRSGNWLRNAREIYVNRFDLPGRHTSVPRLLLATFDLGDPGPLLSVSLSLILTYRRTLSIAMQDHNDRKYRDLMLALAVSVRDRGQKLYMAVPG